MTTRHRVSCIKPDGADPDNRIDGIGGLNADNSRWYLPEDRAIAGMKAGDWQFYVVVNGQQVEVIIASHGGREYLKTEADGYKPNNLLSLPTCP
jgi:hypothetical protein